MRPDGYRYTFSSKIEPDVIEELVHLAILSTAALHGEAAARLDARYAIDSETRTCVIDSRTDIGVDLNRLFLGFAREELGATAFTVDPVASSPCDAQTENTR